jgi:hypothetical protein
MSPAESRHFQGIISIARQRVWDRAQRMADEFGAVPSEPPTNAQPSQRFALRILSAQGGWEVDGKSKENGGQVLFGGKKGLVCGAVLLVSGPIRGSNDHRLQLAGR